MTKLSRTVINFWLDALLLLLLLVLMWVSFVVRFAFPPGPDADGWYLWERTYSQWCDLQFALMCTFAFAILLHVMLHWTWVCGVVTGRFLARRSGAKTMLDDGTRTIYGVGLLIGLLTIMGIGLAAAKLSIQAPY